MELTVFIEKWFGWWYLILGGSLFIHASRWKRLLGVFVDFKYYSLLTMCFVLPLGLFLVLTHNIWVMDFSVLLTLIGWLALLKAVLLLYWPEIILKAIPKQEKQIPMLKIEGIVVVGLASLILYGAYF